jgi:hypothetical protein
MRKEVVCPQACKKVQQNKWNTNKAKQTQKKKTLHLLAAVGCLDGQTGEALAAHLLVSAILLGQRHESGFDNTTAQTKDQVQCGLLLDVVVSKCATILELLSSKDQSLLIWGNALLILLSKTK